MRQFLFAALSVLLIAATHAPAPIHAGQLAPTVTCADGSVFAGTDPTLCDGDGGIWALPPAANTIISLPTTNTFPATVSGPAGSPVSSVTLAPATTATACTSYTGGACVTQCSDGLWSSITARGTCSGHGGEAH